MTERELFVAALEIDDPAARKAHLRSACGDDADLLRRVESLLASHEDHSQFLETPVVEQLEQPPGAGTAATIFLGNSSMQDESPDASDKTTQRNDPMTRNQGDPDDEFPLEYLQPSTQPGSRGRLGHYEILGVLGRGAFGTVFKAFDDKLQRVVAIKVMAPELAATSPARKRFLREAQAAAAIRHEHVVSIYAVEEVPIPYLVMEHIPGQTLQQRLDERGPLGVPDVLRLGTQIAEGLAAAHARELIHRDVKPGNILLETENRDRVKITDFGLARAADDASVTQSGTIAGTPMYMAPEQALGHKLDQRADLFSLGSVLYQMVSGRPPFRAPTTLAVLKRLTEETPRPIEEIIPETPAWLCAIISKMHAKNPDDRYQTAQEIADVLVNCEAQLKTQAGLQDFTLIPRDKAQRSRWWKWAAAAVVVLPLVAYGVYALTRDSRPEKEIVDARRASAPASNGLPMDVAQAGWDGWPADAPPPAIAPFDAAEAKQHQRAWAEYLKLPVERTNSIGMKLVLIPPGEFTMGSTAAEIEEALEFAGDGKLRQACIQSEAPQHKVMLTQPIYLGVHEVTQKEYEAVMTTNPAHFASTGPGKDAVANRDTQNHPVETVSWNDAAEFCARLSQNENLEPFYSRKGETVTQQEGTGYRLPTEAEWEFACRAGTTTRYWFGDNEADLQRAGWFGTNSGGRTQAAGELNGNPLGLFDIHGNVWELVNDWWAPAYYGQFSEMPAVNPRGPSSAGSQRVVRGGNWGFAASFCRASNRFAVPPAGHGNLFGFRVALVAVGSRVSRR